MRDHRRLSYVSILAAVVGLAVAVPGTASAKGPEDARVDGPGLAEPIGLNWESNESELSGLIDATGFWDLAEKAAMEPEGGDLGERYVVSFSISDETGNPSSLSLHAYPFAQPEPLVYVPAGQEAFPMGAVPEGWRTSTTALTAWFEEIGASSAPIVAAREVSSEDRSAVAATSSGTGGQWLLVSAGAAVLVLAGLLVVTVRRRATASAQTHAS